ncbi:MAG TPA: hypothetical protein VJO32_01460 [Ktedonobacteraceae bacterium]|nr:hypothetical protein [Ktedonobacteraceae bacterium]
MFDDRRQTGQQGDAISFSWWSWRPGIRPGRALLLGIPLVFLAFFFVLAGIYSLFSILIDSNAPPTRIAGVVTGYTTSILDNQPHVSIHLQRNGRSSTITPTITSAEQRAIQIGDAIVLDYSPRLAYLYALEDHGQRYDLPGGSPLSNLFASIALIPLGLLFLPYPLFLTVWGWRDLHQKKVIIKGKVVGLRNSQRTRQGQPRRATHPGLTPRIGRAWYGVALASLDSASEQDVMTFAIREEQYKSLYEGQMVQLRYSPHLHYVLSIQPAENDTQAIEAEQEQAR